MLNLLNLKNQPGRQRGFALLIVLTSLLIVVILANIILSIVLNQSRLTRHRVSRIQAYYAAQMGMVYAMEKLRIGAIPTYPYTWYIYRSLCTNAPIPAQCTQDGVLHASINSVTISFKLESGLTNITSIANYTYNNP